jgi:hypothetical protein
MSHQAIANPHIEQCSKILLKIQLSPLKILVLSTESSLQLPALLRLALLESFHALGHNLCKEAPIQC